MERLSLHDVMAKPVENLYPCCQCGQQKSNGTSIPQERDPAKCGYLFALDGSPKKPHCRRLQVEITTVAERKSL